MFRSINSIYLFYKLHLQPTNTKSAKIQVIGFIMSKWNEKSWEKKKQFNKSNLPIYLNDFLVVHASA